MPYSFAPADPLSMEDRHYSSGGDPAALLILYLALVMVVGSILTVTQSGDEAEEPVEQTTAAEAL